VKPLLMFAFLALASSVLLAADYDGHAAEDLVAAVNSARSANDSKAFDALLASSLNSSERAAISAFEQATCAQARRPFSEVMMPYLKVRAVHPITDDVLEVDAVNIQMGSMGQSHDNVVIIIKKDGSQWRIALVRASAYSLRTNSEVP